MPVAVIAADVPKRAAMLYSSHTAGPFQVFMTEIVVPECQDQIPDCIHGSFNACCLARWRHGLEG